MAHLFKKVHVMNGKKDYLPLWEAMRKGYADIVEIFIGLGANPELKEEMLGHTFLHVVSSYFTKDGYIEPKLFEVAKVLIRNGANVNMCSVAHAIAPLHLAVCSGNLQMAELLLSHGAKLDISSWNGSMPALMALEIQDDWRCKQMLQLLFKYGLSTKYRNEHGQNLLHILIRSIDRKGRNSSKVPVAEFLIDCGIPVNGYDGYGCAPLHYAINNKDKNLVLSLIKKGADVNLEDKAMLKYPLFLTLLEKNEDLAEILIAHGADVNARDNVETGFTALHAACIKRSVRIVDLLISKGAYISPMEMTGSMTPLGLVVPLWSHEDPNECTKSIIREIARLMFENQPVSDYDMNLILEHKKLRKFLKSCTSELTLMADTRFYGSFSFHSLAKRLISTQKLATLLKQVQLVEKYKKMLQKLSHYKYLLDRVFSEAIELRNTKKIVYSRLNSIFRDCFTQLIIEKLTESLTLDDLPLQ